MCETTPAQVWLSRTDCYSQEDRRAAGRSVRRPFSLFLPERYRSASVSTRPSSRSVGRTSSTRARVGAMSTTRAKRS